MHQIISFKSHYIEYITSKYQCHQLEKEMKVSLDEKVLEASGLSPPHVDFLKSHLKIIKGEACMNDV